MQGKGQKISKKNKQESPGISPRALENGGYLLSHDAISAVPSAMLCVGGSAASLPRPCALRACETIWHLMWTEWQKVDNLAEKFRLAQMLQDRGCKRKVRETSHVQLRNNIV